MTKKKEHVAFMTPLCEAVWPKLTEPDYKYKKEGQFTVRLRTTVEEAADILANMQAIQDELYSELTKAEQKVTTIMPRYTEDVDEDGEPTGYILLSCKMNHLRTNKKGETKPVYPDLFDAKKNQLPRDTVIWGGSIIRVGGSILGSVISETDKKTKKKEKFIYASLWMNGVQVQKLVQGGSGSQFDELEDGYVASPSEGASSPDDTGDDDDEF